MSSVNINGYYVHQKISDEIVQFDFYESKYEVYTYDDICDLFDLHQDDSLQIMLYKDTEKKGQVFSLTAYISDVGYINQVDDLELGKSSFEQVVNRYGANYRTIYFSEIYSKVIQYEDKENKINLRLCFADNQLKSVILKRL